MPVERAPIELDEPKIWDFRYEDTVHALELVADYYEWITMSLNFHGSEGPYVMTPEDLEAVRSTSVKRQQEAYFARRDIYELGLLVNATVKQMEEEFGGQAVLDIGCGEGKFGEALSRKPRAKVTFLDKDPQMLAKISTKYGERVLANGLNLPFEDGSFDKVVTAFSSVFWAQTPVESVKALNEAIRVAKVGGSSFILPLFTNTAGARLNEAARKRIIQESGVTLPGFEQVIANDRVRSAQAYALIRSLLKMSEEKYVAITWTDFKGWTTSGKDADRISVIIDKLQPIPPEVLAANLAIAEPFMPPTEA